MLVFREQYRIPQVVPIAHQYFLSKMNQIYDQLQRQRIQPSHYHQSFAITTDPFRVRF